MKTLPGINKNFSKIPINVKLYYEDYKLYGKSSYVYNNKDILQELYKYASVINDPELDKDVILSKCELYGFDIIKNDPNPETRVIYPSDVRNAKYQPFKVNLANGSYDLGDWGDTFFINGIKPVMLNYDGTEAYDLDTGNQELKADGQPSDIKNPDFGGNAMVKFPKMYFKRWEDDSRQYVRISDYKIDDDYKCYQHMYNGNELDAIYLPMYKGYQVNNKLRSLAGFKPTVSVSMRDMIVSAKRNGRGWQIDDWMNTVMIMHLMFLMGKSTDVQKTFGNGHCYDDSLPVMGDTARTGMFYGSSAYTKSIKFFYLENYYGARNDDKLGCVTDGSGNILVKPYSPYLANLDGYINVVNAGTSEKSGYMSKTKMTEYGDIPIEMNGSSTTYIPDLGDIGKRNTVLSWGGQHRSKESAGCAFIMTTNETDIIPVKGASVVYKKVL